MSSLPREEGWFSLSCEFEKWRMKYIDLESYMVGSVFHYTSALALESIFRNKTLWVTKSDFLNDKTEYMYGINLVNKLFEKTNYKYLDKNVFAQINREFKSYLARSFIFSTSQNSDSVNLWGNYSKYEGYNIGFSLRDIFSRMWDMKIYVTSNKRYKDGTIKKHYLKRKDQHESIIMFPGEVIYDTVTQENIIVDILTFLENISQLYYSYARDMDDQNEQIFINLKQHYNIAFGSAIRILISQIQLFKNPVFKQDEEYRIIFDVNRKLDVRKYRSFNGVFIPYIEVVFDDINDTKGLPVESVTIGPKNSLDIAEKGLKLFLKSQGYKITANPECEYKDRLLIRKSAAPLRC